MNPRALRRLHMGCGESLSAHLPVRKLHPVPRLPLQFVSTRLRRLVEATRRERGTHDGDE